MNFDISHILKDWPYDHGQISARRVRGRDGTDKIQLRLDLGLLQMDTAGRPDGERPHGCESLLAYYQRQLSRLGDKEADDKAFELDERDCELLRTEAAMYYHRYLAEFILEEYDAVVRDSDRNLRAMDLCEQYAKEESDRHAMAQYRPYVVMMCTRAKALSALRNNRPKVALAAVKKGAEQIREAFERLGQEDRADNSTELAILRALGKEIEGQIPPDPLKNLQKELALAVREERYEDAAMLRDQLDRMDDKGDAAEGK